MPIGFGDLLELSRKCEELEKEVKQWKGMYSVALNRSEKQSKMIAKLKESLTCDDFCNGGVVECYCGRTRIRKEFEELENVI